MADASFLQTSFLGGEWSPLVQGRMDDPKYRTGMNVCLNGLPIEEGSWVRRPGQRLVGPTRKGAPGVLREFHFAESHSYNLELTEAHLRFLAGAGIVVESFGTRVVTALDTGNPVQITVDAASGWNTGDEVIVQIGTGELNSTVAALLNRQLELTSTGSNTLTVVDAVTGVPIDGTSMVLGSTDLKVTRIADFTTPYIQEDLQAINTVQDQTDLLLLHNSYKPYSVISTNPEEGSDFAVFTLGAVTFKDGPYLDPPTDGTTITSSGLSGSVTLTVAGGSTRFVTTDVGRMVRLFSEPAAWANATAYAVGDQVKFDDAYYQALKINTGKQPDADVVNWAVSTTAAQWTWAVITGWTSTTAVTATLQSPILRTSACVTWRLGLFSDTTGYPTNGTYHEGRLWLTGVIGNRIDGSVSNDTFNFSPTDTDGTVADDNACAYVFNAKDVNEIFWMEPDTLGIICGTQAGEWLVQASAQNDNLTPTSVQAHRRSVYGCANVPPKRTGITITFVQAFNKKVLEYITTDFRGLSARNLAATGKHLTQPGIVELAYQREKVPVIWARTEDGQLLGCTYKRESPYASDPPDFAGWSRHDLGGDLTVESIQAGPNFDGTIDALAMIVSDVNDKRWTLLQTDLFDVDWTIGDAMYVDFAESPSMWEVITGPPKVLRLYSLHYLAGKNVDVFAGGIDAGTLTVAADGHLDIPIDSDTLPLLTSTWLASLTTSTNFHGLGLAIVATPPGVANVPTVTGIQNFDLSALAARFDGGVDIDFDGGRLFVPDSSHGKFGVFSMSTFKLLAGPFTQNATSNGLLFAEDGFLYGTNGGGPNVATLSRISLSTGGVLATFGQPGGPFMFSTTATTWAIPRSMDTLKVNNSTYLVSTAFNASQTGNEVAILNLGRAPVRGISLVGTANMNEAIGQVTKGNPLGGLGQAHILAYGTDQTSAHATFMGLYTVIITAGVAAMRRVATVAASGLGTGFTHVSGCSGIILDETDGNIIAHIVESGLPAYNSGTTYGVGSLVSSAGHDYQGRVAGNIGNTPASSPTQWTDLGVSGTNGGSVAKINVHTGAVMWTIATSGVASGNQVNSTRIRSGRYNYLDLTSPHSNVHSINTITGADTVSSNLSVINGAQFSDDRTGNIYFNASYSGGIPPTQIGTTPSSFNSWATLGPAAGPAIPAALPPSDGVTWTTPVAIGYTYNSRGQILRAIAPSESGAQNGPALGKTRRGHMFSTLLFKTQGIEFGTDFSFLRPAQLDDNNETTALPLTTLYSKVLWDTLDDTYSFDSMICWEVTRPYPANVCSIGAFLHTQDR